MTFRIVADKVAAPKFKQNLAGLHDRFQKAFSAAMNMAASMIKQQGDADISKSGNFGARWTSGFHVNVTGNTLGNMRIVMTHDEPGAGLFESGGTVKGDPLLWIPLSGTDAVGVRAKDYNGGLFSVNRKSGGAPLLFSIADKQPKYFGIEQVTIPRKFHLRDVQKSVMGNFRQLFDQAMKA
jgi:hypothetical protein